MGDSPALLEAHDLTRIYGVGATQTAALRGVTLSIRRGEMIAIMGASGSGKSTLMNIIGLLDRPTTGRYLVDGVDTSTLSVHDLAELRNQRLGFVFQQFHLLPRTAAVANVELPLVYRRGVKPKERRERATAALGRVGLKGRERSRPTQLSGGQQQRVAIARALVGDPPIVLADEPTGNLDTRTGLEILALFQELHREGRTILMVTHEADVAQCCERVVVLRDGRILSDKRVDAPTNAARALDALPPLEAIAVAPEAGA